MIKEGAEEYKPVELPDYDKNWQKFVEGVPGPHLFQSEEKWKEPIDAVMICWQVGKRELAKRVSEFSAALSLPNVSSLERVDAKDYLRVDEEAWSAFGKTVTEVVAGKQISKKELEELAGDAETLTGDWGRAQDDQALATLTAMNQVNTEISAGAKYEKDPAIQRQLMLQTAFNEMFTKAFYQMGGYTAAKTDDEVPKTTTQDVRWVEENQLIGALHSKLWDENTTKENRKAFMAFGRVIRSGENNIPEELADDLKKIWRAASKGEGCAKISAIALLQKVEDVYNAMREGGGFDIDLTEFQEEGDEEEENE